VTQADVGDPPPRTKPLGRRLLSAALLLVVVAAFAFVLAGRWREIFQTVGEQAVGSVVGAFAFCLVAVIMTFLLWRGVLATLGSPVRLLAGARIFFVAQLGKYLPGSVWPVVIQMQMGRAAGIPRNRSGLAFFLTLGLSVVWGLMVGLLALPALMTGADAHVVWLVLLLPVVVLLLVPRVVNALLDRILRLFRRPGLEEPIAGASIAAASAWTGATWVVFGLHVWLLAVGLGAEPLATLPVAIGGFALAFSIGPLFVVLPAGAGVREAVLVIVLATVLTTPEATAVALTSRGLLLATDGLLAVAGLAGPKLSARS
jgi:glycosyltransferase 2 family protein